jgi:hypothetical protein
MRFLKNRKKTSKNTNENSEEDILKRFLQDTFGLPEPSGYNWDNICKSSHRNPQASEYTAVLQLKACIHNQWNCLER